MSLEALFRRLFTEYLEDAARSKEFVTIDSAGRARFDVTSYVLSDEGRRRVHEIAESNRAASTDGQAAASKQ